MSQPLDANLTKPADGGASFPLKHRILRLIWNIAWFLFASWTLPQMHGWRRLLLRAFGAKMEGRCDVRGGAKIWYPPNLHMKDKSVIASGANCYNMAPVSLGPNVIVSQGAYLCAGTHDIDNCNFQLIVKPIVLEDDCWVAADAFVGPGVTIKRRAVLGARGVTFKDLEEGKVYGGNPAKYIRNRKVDCA